MKQNKLLQYILSFVFLVLMLFPFLLVFTNSLKDRISIVKDPLSLTPSAGLSNYISAFNTMKYGSAIVNSTIITTFSLLVIVVFSSMFAYFLVRWDWKINKLLFLLVVASMIVPFQALMIPFVTIYGTLGILNSVPSLIFFYLGFGLSMATFMYHGFIKNISVEIEEAAIIDGCGRFSGFWRIVFPMLKPITSTILILDILWIWNDYLLPSLVLINDYQRTLPLSTFYFFGNYSSEFGFGMAALVMSVIPIIIVYILLQKQIIKGVMDGAIK